jgi:hypothetical protein
MSEAAWDVFDQAGEASRLKEQMKIEREANELLGRDCAKLSDENIELRVEISALKDVLRELWERVNLYRNLPGSDMEENLDYAMDAAEKAFGSAPQHPERIEGGV